MEHISKEQKQLIEEVGLMLEERSDLSPLAARIYAALILSCYDGLSFDNIIQITQASKSSVSSNINVLIQLHYIEYYTKPGDRKRYFRTSRFYIMNTMEQHLFTIDKELEIVQKINTFNKANNPDKFKNEKYLGSLFEEYLKDQREKITSKLKKITDFQNQA
ncbi:GbsR/MarR family transcriptional regulator [Mariniflexile ostreae]|uniref:GbsR/MarR family transcriptional regulator n=1 Tax=Mariniflexile ostreae TaxID=1520892 RepID=A0ABV5FFN2_9FLAO